MAVGIFSQSLLKLLTDVEVDAKTAEQHGMTATPATFALENAAIVSDHIVLDPLTISVPFELNNQDVPGVGSSYGVRAAGLYNTLRQNLTSRQLYTLVTRHVLYENMALIDISADHTSPDAGTLRGTAKFQQINRPSISSVQVAANTLAQDGTQFKAASTVPIGFQLTKTVDSVPSFFEDI